jgi:ferredoxin-NADP reductase
MKAISNEFVTTVVSRVHRETDRVTAYELVQPEGWDLPHFTPGAHIDVHIPGGFVRQYSLSGDPARRYVYRIGVLHSAGTRGSCAMRAVREGDWLSVSLPRNFFPLAPDAEHHILIAGGIGVTPFLSMAAALQRAGKTFELHVCSRSAADTPFRTELSHLKSIRFYHSTDDAPSRLDVRELLINRRPQEHVYCCGPVSLMQAVRDATQDWNDASRSHFERFAPGATELTSGLQNYRIVLNRQNREIEVRAGETMLQALLREQVEVDYGCEGGTCGRCRVRYVAGDVEHRDFVLAGQDRQTFVMPCTAGSRSEMLILDL